MRDAIGQEVKIGSLVQVMLGNPAIPVRGFVTEIKTGGMMIMASKTNPPGQTPDIVVLQVEVPLLDAQPGQNHQALLRIPIPDKEYIISKDN